tara:strand:- start:158 stop:610 length:453 start_codon:yes stop_codon:yes gene_type:complete
LQYKLKGESMTKEKMTKDKNKTFTPMEINCIEVAIQDLIDQMKDMLVDRKKMDKEELNHCLNVLKSSTSVKKKLWSLGTYIDDLKKSHCSVTPKQVEKFTNAYDYLDSDSWISEILNAKINVNKLRLVIADPKCGEDGKDINYLWSENIT